MTALFIIGLATLGLCVYILGLRLAHTADETFSIEPFWPILLLCVHPLLLYSWGKWIVVPADVIYLLGSMWEKRAMDKE